MRNLANREFDIIAISPFASPDPSLTLAVCRAGAIGVLDLGTDRRRAEAALAEITARARGPFGILVRETLGLLPAELPAGVDCVVTEPGVGVEPWKAVACARRLVLAQVTSLEQARQAIRAGADGLIAKGHESGGRVGEETTFVLLQRIAAELDAPVWAQGGIGPHTAPACVAGGARGVVLDSQLALVRESKLGERVRTLVASTDGSETAVVGGHRILRRPDLPLTRSVPDDPHHVAGLLGADDLDRQLLAAGQDIAFATGMARRYRTAGSAIRAIRMSIGESLRSARELKPVGPGSPLAAAHGIAYPIVQGPMTRVSDHAGFAESVSRAGGLPFIALSLMRGPAARELLTETRNKLAGRPWGVGILGFVPEDLRAEQLNVIEEILPPVAIIAGGRPAQARALEERGIVTYLHVPSPGLLDMFLADGARHFIFEGRECGGHVGPRSSFALWEAQIARLLAFERPEQLSILFAGGIHDARSAAMVSAMAAPLAARGARIGVLMGTAYLFTTEAVEAGAILPGFQEEALQCRSTVLLETAPGHATRCTDSAFVRDFLDRKAVLEARGVEPKAIWQELESLNVGRLRIASKGLRREGDELVDVDEAGQKRDGMYMIGQVAALRDATCTMAQLHRDVSDGASSRLDALDLPEEDAPRRQPVDVAVVGMACIYPDASDTRSFWTNILRGVNSITEVPAERWNVEAYYDPDPAQAGLKTPSRWGGFIPEVPFDPLRYGLPPRALGSIEPVQLLSLEVARRALADAGYADREFDRDKTSVIFGAEAGTDLSGAYGFRAMLPQYTGGVPAELDEALPRLTEDSFPGVLTNVITGRIANRLDLGGVNYTVDAACAASLAAVDLAVKELCNGTSEMVLCGGADLHNSINDYLMFASVQALSPRGQCRTFDSRADGIVLGEGVACVVLKRLADAERDGDRVYAVIKGIAGSSDGRSLGLTAPRQEGQARALERAYERAGVSPSEVGLVEAHGTGTVVGDRTELAALTDVFSEAGASTGGCTLGSVKSQIGHTKCAAGLAGLIKASLSLYHRVLPPTGNVENPNPAYDEKASPFTLDDAPRPWIGENRKAAVSAFGFGGTNFHAVLAAHDHDDLTSGMPCWPAELFLFRGASREEALVTVERLLQRAKNEDECRLVDLAAATARSGEGRVRIALVARSIEDLTARLERLLSGAADPEDASFAGGTEGPLAFLFPGQGSQRVGMLRDLFVAFPRLHRYLRLGQRFASRIFPAKAWSAEERNRQKTALEDTRVAQPALGITGLALADLLGRLGVRPEMAGGHSYGELVALSVAGCIDPAELLELSAARGECILAAAGDDPGTMAAVAADAKTVADCLAGVDGVVVANDNSPRQTVISGTTEGIETARGRLEQKGVAARSIPVSCGFHSPVVADASRRLAERLEEVTVGPAAIPVWSNTTAEVYPAEAKEIRARLAEHVARPVRFREQIESMYEAGARIFVEVGPGTVLSGLVARVLGDRPHVTVPCNPTGRDGVQELLGALARLAVSGVDIDGTALFEGRETQTIDLSAEPAKKRMSSVWLVNGQWARPRSGELPDGAYRPVAEPVMNGDSLGGKPGPGVGRDRPEACPQELALEFLRNMRELAASQRDVMLGLLGGEASAARAEQPLEPAAEEISAPALIEPEPVVAGSVATALEERKAVATQDLASLLIEVVSEKTGYPAEMLEPDLDLEADLSIDSIKRVEILGALSERMGLAEDADADRDAFVEELAALKTLRQIVEWLERDAADAKPAAVSATPAIDEAPAAVEEEAPTDGADLPLRRFVLNVEEVPRAARNCVSLDRRSFVVTDDGRGVARRLIELLEQHGASAQLITNGDRPRTMDGLIHLSALRPGVDPDPIKELFDLSRQAVIDGAQWIFGVTGLGGAFGRGNHGNGRVSHGGVAGLLKTVSKECPRIRVRAIDVDPGADAEAVAGVLVEELLAEDDFLEVGYENGTRHTLSAVPADRNGHPPSPRISLDARSVVLVTGGARGIAARVSRELAGRYGCHLEVVGRSCLPEGEDPAPGVPSDLPLLRKHLLDSGMSREPRTIEAECRRILRGREICASLEAVSAHASGVCYHAVDVCDRGAFSNLIDDVYARHGRLDGVIHAAGVIEDRLLKEKTRDSFDRVYDTKVLGARTLMDKVRNDVRFVVFFSSVSGAFGNRGQVDYSAANDALDKMALELNRRIAGRVVSINWGPWAGGGMVSAELEREYARRGIGLIRPDEGVAKLFDELRQEADDGQVILMCADPRSMTG